MQDLPTAAQLLAAIAQTLTTNVVPATTGAIAHEARVAANLCAILSREAELGSDFDEEARALLASVLDKAVLGETALGETALNETALNETALNETALGESGEPTATELNDRLYVAIMGGGADVALSATALEQIVANKLAVAKPGYDSYDFAAERALATDADTADD